MKKDVTVKENAAVANPLSGKFDTTLASAGDTLDAVDLRIPKLTLIQQMTKSSFNTEKAPVGNYIDSIEKTDMGSTMDLFIMNDTKLWELKHIVKDGNKTKEEYLGTIDYTPANADLRDNRRIPQELAKKAADKGVTAESLGQINMINRFYVLKVEEVLEGIAFPYIIDFKRASYPAGVQLKNSFFKMKKVQGLPSYARVFTLSSEFVQDEFEYYVKSVSAGRMIDEEEIAAVENWVREMVSNKAKYQDDETVEEEYVDAEVVDAMPAEGSPKF